MKRIAIFLIVCVIACGCQAKKAEEETPAGQTLVDKEISQQYYAKGLQYLKESKGVEAIKNFDKAIKQNPLDPKGYVTLGQVYLHMKVYDKAVDTFSAAIRIAPQEAEAYYFLAISHNLHGNKEMAVKNAKISSEIFRRTGDKDNFVKALTLLQGLVQADGAEQPEEQAEEK